MHSAKPYTLNLTHAPGCAGGVGLNLSFGLNLSGTVRAPRSQLGIFRCIDGGWRCLAAQAALRMPMTDLQNGSYLADVSTNTSSLSGNQQFHFFGFKSELHPSEEFFPFKTPDGSGDVSCTLKEIKDDVTGEIAAPSPRVK